MDEFLALVRRMRRAQKDYFASPYGERKDAYLKEAKRLEAEVDRWLATPDSRQIRIPGT